MPILPLRIWFSGRAIDDLHRRLEAARWPRVPFQQGWDAGTDDLVLRELVRYWRYEFDWFAVQERLNELAHLRGPVNGEGSEELHWVLLSRGTAAGAPGRVPLLLLHGWPGSFMELLPAAERLVEGAHGGGEHGRGFDVVVPSLPGFGFSDAPREPGMHPGQIAERMHQLMLTMGYEHYGVQGGDWGAVIGARLARAHPEAVLGLHLTMGGELLPPPPGTPPDEEELASQRERERWNAREGAYAQLQSTKPQSLTYALNDSPVGLLAWMLEKFHRWSDRGAGGGRDDGLWSAFERDAVLANVTLYWLTGTAPSAARTYFEARNERRQRERPRPRERSTVPTAFARFPAEPWQVPRSALERSYHLVRYRELPRGGHFAALEQPELFARDVAEFFTGLG